MATTLWRLDENVYDNEPNNILSHASSFALLLLLRSNREVSEGPKSMIKLTCNTDHVYINIIYLQEYASFYSSKAFNVHSIFR